jgi:hypothetical protein
LIDFLKFLFRVSSGAWRERRAEERGEAEAESSAMADWQLQSCCGHSQIAFIATIGAFFFIILAVSLPWSLAFGVWCLGEGRASTGWIARLHVFCGLVDVGILGNQEIGR